MSERFAVGDRVRVLASVQDGNPRTPRYLRSWSGTVIRQHGVVHNPLDHRDDYPPLYSIVFDLPGTDRAEVVADLHDEWLAPADE